MLQEVVTAAYVCPTRYEAVSASAQLGGNCVQAFEAISCALLQFGSCSRGTIAISIHCHSVVSHCPSRVNICCVYVNQICAPVEGLLEAGAVCKSLQAVHNALNDRVKSISSQPTRRPIQWQPKKLAQIKMFNPRFDEDYNMDRSSDPVKERAEANKLKKRVNRDLKHTMRELQQGAALVAQARDKKQQEKMDIRKTKMNKHKGELEAQQHNFNHPTMGIGEKSKRNRKRKSG